MKTTIGVLGAAFNPPTLGHKDVLKQSAPYYDKILLVPSACHAFAKSMLPFNYRLEMLTCFVQDIKIKECIIEVSDIEIKLFATQPHQPIFTFDVLNALTNQYSNLATISFIRGPDNAHPAIWNRFYRASDIEKQWSIFTAQEQVQVRSSFVRQLLLDRENSSDKMKQFLTPRVYAYIKQKKLYTNNIDF